MKRSIIITLTGLALLGFATHASADNCSITVDSDDNMQFDTDEITIDRSCDSIELTLTHSGEMPVTAMGHNIVFTTADDLEDLAEDAMAASDDDYVPAGDDRVIAATDLIGGGESTTLELDPGLFEEGGDYRFFCSFPGHWNAMQGTVQITD
ncbi:azurin [Natronospira proteinivora]|uniref:Azurin n=1 Tax=Natronospira proteinivora TaxID=1807133 RepID=A0ABT1GBS5_9GAMM|nr:azurin [Natronospira proteinivora]MCP1728380.1 azurin [Natronospira proteinivora]